jgi:hypothetical protein
MTIGGNDRRQTDGRGASMSDREPLNRDPNPGRKPGKAVPQNLGLRSGLAALPSGLERRMVGLQDPAAGESRAKWGIPAKKTEEKA